MASENKAQLIDLSRIELDARTQLSVEAIVEWIEGNLGWRIADGVVIRMRSR